MAVSKKKTAKKSSKKKASKKSSKKKASKKASKKKAAGKKTARKKVAAKKATTKKPASRKRAAVQVPEDAAAPSLASVSLQRESYFATHVYYVDLPQGRRLSADLEEKIRALRADDPKGIVRSNVQSLGAWHSVDNLQRNPDFGQLAAIIQGACQQVFIDLGYNKESAPFITNMWANVSPRYAFNRVHTHPGTAWSGVYYVQAPKNSGKLYFQDPRPQAQVYPINFDREISRKRETWAEVFYEPIVGRLILFPAWLQHEVQPNLTELEGEAGDRISISFNIRQAPVAKKK